MAELKKRGPYGHVLAEAVREELADEALALGGTVRELRGYVYAVINGHALFPFRYADVRSRSIVRGCEPMSRPSAGAC
ncbi:hypothetical protein OG243_12120 [Streptomyces sp. NBC_01318]|uniref:hypothetical protein n=1 Tax=Streptomyces sp. NBC_01318 TaxID=2903823 RepID=UPI002E115FD6|nr:hypothetical protein OG243_12120 [Streptomyces sp. NBC_01318]